MKIEDHWVILNSGRCVYGYGGCIGIMPGGTATYGYDGYLLAEEDPDEPLTPAERQDLARYMIAAWAAFGGVAAVTPEPATELVARLWCVPDMLDRVKRINARRVAAKGEEFWLPDGYFNPELFDGYNIVRAYIADVASDIGVDVTKLET